MSREAQAADPTPGYPSIQRAFLREDFAAAAAMAQTFITENPAVPEAPRVWLWLVLSLDRLQRQQDALHQMDLLKSRLGSEDALWPEVLFWEGEVSRRMQQMTRAKLSYQRLLEQYPSSTWAAQAQLGLGLIYLHQQAFEQAIGHFHEVALRRAEAPVAFDALLFEGLCHLRLGHFQDAVGIFQPLLARLSDPVATAQAAFYLGESLSGLKRYEDAAAAYQRAISASESSLWAQHALFGLGWAYYKAGRCDKTIGTFKRYLARGIGANRTEALFAQASCLAQEGQPQEALARFQQILASDPDHPFALESGLAMADLQRQQGQFEAGKELLHSLLRGQMDELSRARIQLRLGAIALDQGNAAQARTVFNLASENSEPTIRQAALSGLGDTHLLLGNAAGAKQFYEEAIRIADQTPVAHYASYQVGRWYLQQRAFDEAAAIFRRVAAGADGTLADDARLALALTYLNQGDKAQARTVLDAVRQQQPTGVSSARAAYYLALLALDTGDETAARSLGEEAVARASKTEEAVDARLLLADLLVSRTSTIDAMSYLEAQFTSAGLPPRQRAKIARRLGDLARTDQHHRDAARWYEEAQTLLPSSGGELDYRIASCYEESGDTDEAIRRYQAISQPSWRVRARLAVAKLLERQNRLSEAEAIYRSLAVEQIPEADVAQERLAALTTKKGTGRAVPGTMRKKKRLR